MELALKVAIPIAGGLVLLFVVLKVVVSGARRRVAGRMEARCRGQTVVLRDDWVNLFGQRSQRVRVRGNGALALTDGELIFLLAVPAREIVIPREAIVSVSHPKSFLGRSILGPLLVVAFRGEGGAEDEVGWAVRNPEEWGRAIEQTRSPGA